MLRLRGDDGSEGGVCVNTFALEWSSWSLPGACPGGTQVKTSVFSLTNRWLRLARWTGLSGILQESPGLPSWSELEKNV